MPTPRCCYERSAISRIDLYGEVIPHRANGLMTKLCANPRTIRHRVGVAAYVLDENPPDAYRRHASRHESRDFAAALNQ